MGSGTLKILLSKEVPHDKFLYILPCTGHAPQPCIRLLLGGLCVSHQYLIVFRDTSVIYDGFASSALLIPCMLRAIATKVSLFVTGIALNFAEVSL